MSTKLFEFFAIIGLAQPTPSSTDTTTTSCNRYQNNNSNSSSSNEEQDCWKFRTGKPVLYDVFPTFYSEEPCVKEIAPFCFPYGAREILHTARSSKRRRPSASMHPMAESAPEPYRRWEQRSRSNSAYHRHVRTASQQPARDFYMSRSLSGEAMRGRIRKERGDSDGGGVRLVMQQLQQETDRGREIRRASVGSSGTDASGSDADTDANGDDGDAFGGVEEMEEEEVGMMGGYGSESDDGDGDDDDDDEKTGNTEDGHKRRRKREKLHEWDNVKHPHLFGFVITDEKKAELFASCLQFHVPVVVTRKRMIPMEQTHLHGGSPSSSNSPKSDPFVSSPLSSASSPVSMMPEDESHESISTPPTQYRKKSLMIGALEFTFDSVRSNQPAVQRSKKTISPHGIGSVFNKSQNEHRQQDQRQTVQYRAIYEKIRVYQPMVMLLVTRLPLYSHCRRLLMALYHNYVSPSQNGHNFERISDGVPRSWIHGPGIKLIEASPHQEGFGEFYTGLQKYLSRFGGNNPQNGDAASATQATLMQLLPLLYRQLHNLIFYTPMPPPGKIDVAFHFFTDTNVSDPYRIGLPEMDDFPVCDVPIRVLFECLGESNVVSLVNHVLFDSKIVLVSESLSILNICMEAVRKLIYPFSWPFTVITVLPLEIIGMLDAPVPFMIGVHRSLLGMVHQGLEEAKRFSTTSDVDDVPVIVDLDRNTISRPPTVPFPRRNANRLIDRLRKLWRPNHVTFDRFHVHGQSQHVQDAQTIQIQERKTRELFLKFLCWMVGSLEGFLKELNEEDKSSLSGVRLALDEESYLGSRPSEYRDFLSGLIRQTCFDEFKYSFEDSLIYKQLTAMETSREIASFFRVKQESLMERDISYPLTFHAPTLPQTIHVEEEIGNQTVDSVPKVSNFDRDDEEELDKIATDAAASQSADHRKVMLCPKREKQMEQDAIDDILHRIYDIMHDKKDPDLQARLYLMRISLWERKHQPLKALQDLSCVNDVNPMLVKQQFIFQNLMKLQEHEMGFVVGMSDLVRVAFQNLNRASPSVANVKKLLLVKKETSERETNKRAQSDRNAEETWINRLTNNRRSSIDFSSLSKSFHDLRKKYGSSSKGIINRSQLYVLATTSGLFTRSHTASIVYDALRDNQEDREVLQEDALNLFSKLEDLVDQNDKIARKLPLDHHDIIIMYTTLCSDRRGSVGRLFLSLQNVYFGLSNQHVKVCSLADVRELHLVDRVSQQYIPGRKDESSRPSAHGSGMGTVQELIVITTANGEEHEFRFTSDRDTYFVYLEELRRINRETAGLSPDEQHSRRREIGTLILLERALHLLKKSVRQSLFDEQNFTKRKTKAHVM